MGKVRERGGDVLQDVISREALEHVVTEYKVGGYSFKIMRANGDKQPKTACRMDPRPDITHSRE